MPVYESIWSRIHPSALRAGEAARETLLAIADDTRHTVSAVDVSGPDCDSLSDEYRISVDVFDNEATETVPALTYHLHFRDGADDGYPEAFGLLIELEGPDSTILYSNRLCDYTDDADEIADNLNDANMCLDAIAAQAYSALRRDPSATRPQHPSI